MRNYLKLSTIITRTNSLYLKRTIVFKHIAFGILVTVLTAQIDRRYDPDDWILFTQPGRITSISEGLSYIYFGSALGGIQRYQYYAGQFDFPLTVAQGLPENSVETVHFDKNTGILWAVTRNYICYSYDRVGDWYYQSKKDYGIPENSRVVQMGHDQNYIWVLTQTMAYQLDHNSGILLGAMPNPGFQNVVWSSGRLRRGEPLPEFLIDYSINDGWTIFPDRFLDNYGRDILPTTVLQQEFGEIWIGTVEGYILKADIHQESIAPLRVGLANNDVNLIIPDDSFWLAGDLGRWTRGVTRFSWKRNFVDWYEFDVTINLSPVSFYKGLARGNEIWLAGNAVLGIYNKKEDFWRTVMPVTFGRILALAEDSTTIWMGLTTGVLRIDPKTKREISSDVLDRLEQRRVFDIESFQGQTWLATDEGLYVFNPQNSTLLRGNEYDSNLDCLMFPTWQISTSNDSLFVVNKTGLWLWTGKTCYQIVAATSFHNRPVTGFQIVDQRLFVSTTDGLYRVNTDGSGFYAYNYPFMNPVNDMYISDDECWLATNYGLVLFNWRSDP